MRSLAENRVRGDQNIAKWASHVSGKLATGSTLPRWKEFTAASIIDATGHVRTPRGQLAKESLLRNLTILERLGCLTPDNLAKLRRGRAPTITRGPYAGEQAEVDHIAPVSKAPRFENWIGNLEFMPRTLNRRKSDKMGERQEAMLNKLRAASEKV
ncbi:hypothetical protein OAF58_00780 [bacterium]|nr:hypothetical protein [bacterium]